MTSLGQTCNVRRGKWWSTCKLSVAVVSPRWDLHWPIKSRWWCKKLWARSIRKTFRVASSRSEQTRVEAILGCKIDDFLRLSIYRPRFGFTKDLLYTVDLDHIIDRNHRFTLIIQIYMIEETLSDPHTSHYVCVTSSGLSYNQKVTLMMQKNVRSLNWLNS